jgi:hypothetical protein
MAMGYRKATAHRPTTAKVGFLTQGLTADKGQAESAKQTAPLPFDREMAAGITTITMTRAPRAMAAALLAGFWFVIAPVSVRVRDLIRCG